MDRNEKGQFVKGPRPERRYPVGTILVRTRSTRNHDQRKFIKIEDPDKWQKYSRYVWEKYNGPIPKGYGVHHIDENSLNDTIDNLQLVSKSEHLVIHRDGFNNEKRIRNSTDTRRKRRWSTKSKTKITGRHPALCDCPLHKT
jgi:hypothetical protein